MLKAKEGTELATQAPSLMMGDSLMDASSGFDTVQYREPMGVFAGIVPVNFPAMIPFGWMTPVCLACGNTMVLKAASLTPMTALRIAGLYKEAGLPDGVLNVVTCSREETKVYWNIRILKGLHLLVPRQSESIFMKRRQETEREYRLFARLKIML